MNITINIDKEGLNKGRFVFSMWLIIVCYFTILSCQQNKYKNFNFEVDSASEFGGLVSFSGEHCLYFVKKKFNPNLKIFDRKGVLRDPISLVNAENEIGSIQSVWVLSLDSICVYSHHNGKLVIIDKNGLIKYKRDYCNIKDKNGNRYELLSPYPKRPFNLNNNKNFILSAIGWRGKKDPYTSKQIVDNTRASFQMCKISPFSESKDSLDYLFGVEFTDVVEFQNIEDTTIYFAPKLNTYIVDDKYIMASDYSRYIYELSEDLSIKKRIKVIDDSSSTLRLLPLIEEKDLQSLLDETLEISKTSTYVSNILYNNVSQNYIVILKNGNVNNKEWHNYPFIVQLYNENFIKMKELKVDNYDYIPRKSFVLDGELYMEKKNDFSNIKKYEIIEL